MNQFQICVNKWYYKNTVFNNRDNYFNNLISFLCLVCSAAVAIPPLAVMVTELFV